MIGHSSDNDSPGGSRSRRVPRLVIFPLFDALSWVVALFVASALRGGWPGGGTDGAALALVVAAAIILQAIAGTVGGLYRAHFLEGSFDEARSVLVTELIVGVVLGLGSLALVPGLHISPAVIVIATPFAMVVSVGLRSAVRQRRVNRARPGGSAQRTLVYGAGYLGTHAVRRMVTDPHSPYLPVGFIDDDKTKRRLTIEGLAVLGTLDDLPNVIAATSATALIVSIARADAAFLRTLSDLGERNGVRVLVFPVIEEILDGKSRLRDVRDISLEDLIGRHPVDTQVESMAGYLTGKRILVTGAGGSIGAELCRQISKFAPASLVILDRDETGLQATQLLLEGNGLLTSKNIVLADIRDGKAIRDIFEERRPQVVFHAAALKHLPILERYPDEAWKTNVLGTLNVLSAARAVEVETFVNISTDKAANPTSVLGFSKRTAEGLTAWAASITGIPYLSVRFGNVIGSRGSLIPVFAAMIEAGGPLTVTDADATRFFMTIPEACHLVIQAGGMGRPGEVLILDMGEPVRILDIAERMIARSGRDIGIVFTGLRDGEKLNEELLGKGETDERRIHPKISHAVVSPLDPLSLDQETWKREMVLADEE